MANRHRGEVSFDAAGKTWTMRLSTNALCELEDALGSGVDAIGTSMADPRSAKVKTLRLIMWASLTDHHEGVTVRQAGELIDEIGLDTAMGLVQKAFAAMQPEAKGRANPPKAAAG
ncbi:MAG TPA: GTA-gp10 family protein [Rhizobiaceae bacterium]|nr:GTA-gp10 family protein [Rhizobiaceae bacterium]